jgi:hypothetical protein
MTLISQLKEDLKRLSRLAANISEAHTSAILLPVGLIAGGESSTAANTIVLKSVVPSGSSSRSPVAPQQAPPRPLSIELVAAHTLSRSLARECRLQVGTGLLGWVAEQGRPIHIAPFDVDSSSLGLYTDSEALKSLVALPISIPSEAFSSRPPEGKAPSGVLMCDSKKAYSFSKLQVKHLEDLAAEVSRLLYWALAKRNSSMDESSWESFTSRAERLAGAIGIESVEILRVQLQAFSTLERSSGTSLAVQKCEQFVRLMQQALPPHFPLVRLPNDEVLIALDNMMSTFFQNKIRTLADHLSEPTQPFTVGLATFSARAARVRHLDLDVILRQQPLALKTTAIVASGGKRA